MSKRVKIISLIIIFILCISFSGLAAAFAEDAPTEDLPNSQDHPLISRFPGSYLRYYDTANYDEFNILLNKLEAEDIVPDYEGEELKLEGEITKSFYIAPAKNSSLEIFKNYEKALTEAGFEIIAVQNGDISASFSRKLYEQVNFKDSEETEFEGLDLRGEDGRYLLAKLNRDQGAVYISIFTARHGFYGGSWSDGLPAIFQVVVEEKELADDKIEINSDFKSLEPEESELSEDLPTEDVLDSQDHPLISRFPGSYLRYYDTANYEKFNLPLSKLNDAEIKKEYINDDLIAEGQLSKHLYIAPDDHSPLEIFRNYETAVKKAGFEIIAKKEGEVSAAFSRRLYEQVDFNNSRNTTFEGLDPAEKGAYYLTAKQSRAEGEVYLSIFTARHGFYGGGWPDGLPVVYQTIVEEKDLDSDLISVSGVMKDIQSRGKASIQGIYFEHDSANIKAESQENIEKIAELLNENPELELYVVGHTDYTGSLEYNMDLSERRAEALVERLVSEYNIVEERLIPAGVGPLSPELTNETETGRAENRRVVLVKRE